MPPEPPLAPRASLGPQETLEAFRSLWQPWVLNQAQGPCSPCFPLPLLLLAPHTLSLPGLLGPPWGLRKPWESLEALCLQSDSGTLFPLLSSPHELTCPLSFPGSLEPPWGLRKSWKPLETFSNIGSSVRLRGLVPLAPLTPSFPLTPPCSPHPLNLEHPRVPGTSLGPQEALGAFRSLR